MNVYVHFPFCRSKCAYCALHSRAGRSAAEREEYVRGICGNLEKLFETNPSAEISTIYFGGGTPSLCNLGPVFETIGKARLRDGYEFTVEVNPVDVTPQLLETLRRGGVNRLSMGVQSLDDATLRAMGRVHTAERAEEAWRIIRDGGIGNAGIDLICGWPGPDGAWKRTVERAAAMAPDHCSVYTLTLEPGTALAREVDAGRIVLPSDDEALAELHEAEEILLSAGLERYEISNFAKPGMECRHNLAVWRGEDYMGIGEGAFSREGDAVSRAIFRLRLLKEGFSPAIAAADWPELAPRTAEWTETLERFAGEGLLVRKETAGAASYRLTRRGTEVCDTILAELV